jgi:hypothetical protein
MELGLLWGPVTPTSGKRQEVEAANVDRAARAVLGATGGGLRWGFSLVFYDYSSGEA